MVNMKLTKNKNKGFTLIELMVASTLASLMSFGVLSVYVNQSGNISSESQRDITKAEAHRAFDTVSRLIRQAQREDLKVTFITDSEQPENIQAEYKSKSLVIDFNLPENQAIWPNTSGDDRAVRLAWNTGSDNTVQIQIANASTIDDLSTASLTTLAGSNIGSQPRITNMVFWPLDGQRSMLATQGGALIANADNGYLLQITARAGAPDLAYDNPNESGDFKNYRSYTVSGVVFPRN